MKKLFLALIIAVSTIIMPLLPSAPAYAACPNSNTSKGQVLDGVGQTGGDCSGDGVFSVVQTAVEIISYIAGIAAVIVVILAGLKYITSAGDANKITSAKNTLVYALIGLAIAALAQGLVQFVINTSDNAIKPQSTSKPKPKP